MSCAVDDLIVLLIRSPVESQGPSIPFQQWSIVKHYSLRVDPNILYYILGYTINVNKSIHPTCNKSEADPISPQPLAPLVPLLSRKLSFLPPANITLLT